MRVALIGELIKARQERGITQRELEEMSGVRQPIIARMENGKTTPNVSTVLKEEKPGNKQNEPADKSYVHAASRIQLIKCHPMSLDHAIITQ